MADESALTEKLRKIEALFAGAATAGERAAAGAAADRIRARLRESEGRERAVEIRFSLPDPWSRRRSCASLRSWDCLAHGSKRLGQIHADSWRKASPIGVISPTGH